VQIGSTRGPRKTTKKIDSTSRQLIVSSKGKNSGEHAIAADTALVSGKRRKIGGNTQLMLKSTGSSLNSSQLTLTANEVETIGGVAEQQQYIRSFINKILKAYNLLTNGRRATTHPVELERVRLMTVLEGQRVIDMGLVKVLVHRIICNAHVTPNNFQMICTDYALTAVYLSLLGCNSLDGDFEFCTSGGNHGLLARNTAMDLKDKLMEVDELYTVNGEIYAFGGLTIFWNEFDSRLAEFRKPLQPTDVVTDEDWQKLVQDTVAYFDELAETEPKESELNLANITTLKGIPGWDKLTRAEKDVIPTFEEVSGVFVFFGCFDFLFFSVLYPCLMRRVRE
jgi:hypothetical protein